MLKEIQNMELGGQPGFPRRANSVPVAKIPEFPRNGGIDSRHKLERSIHYMEANFNRPLQVATLAAQANVSPSHFFALFKQLTGRSPMDYFTRLRMRHACRLLGSTSASVKEVAAALGYDDPFYFSRVFKLVNGVPPVRYRGQMAELEDPLQSPAVGPFEREFWGTPSSFPLEGQRNLTNRVVNHPPGSSPPFAVQQPKQTNPQP
jgi:AraC-like DNA-binding protein